MISSKLDKCEAEKEVAAESAVLRPDTAADQRKEVPEESIDLLNEEGITDQNASVLLPTSEV